jgi:hypothetical protein
MQHGIARGSIIGMSAGVVPHLLLYKTLVHRVWGAITTGPVPHLSVWLKSAVQLLELGGDCAVYSLELGQ